MTANPMEPGVKFTKAIYFCELFHFELLADANIMLFFK